jgi:hypothetical protein
MWRSREWRVENIKKERTVKNDDEEIKVGKNKRREEEVKKKK